VYSCDGLEWQAVTWVWDVVHAEPVKWRASGSRRADFWGLDVDPEGVKLCLGEVLAEYGIDVPLHTLVVGADRSIDGLITAVEIDSATAWMAKDACQRIGEQFWRLRSSLLRRSGYSIWQ
jgi:hypothetical protein